MSVYIDHWRSNDTVFFSINILHIVNIVLLMLSTNMQRTVASVSRWLATAKFHRVLIALLMVLGALWILGHTWKYLGPSNRAMMGLGQEGFGDGRIQFRQNEQFLIKRNQDIYDEFYLAYYDQLFRTRPCAEYIFDAAERLTQATPNKSVILDVGCGTGALVQYMRDTKGYTNVYGLDRSPAAVATAKRDGLPVIEGDALSPMTFDKHTFTHIFLTGTTLYTCPDQVALFRNLYYWLMPNAFLIVQMADRDRFDPVPPLAKPTLLRTTVGNAHVADDVRVTDAHVDFVDFVYQSSYDFSVPEIVIVKETFTDPKTRQVRVNEQTLYMTGLADTVYRAQYAGFIVHGQFDLSQCLGDAYQHVFVLERPH
jgi:SAM-dependent methyltransferase